MKYVRLPILILAAATLRADTLVLFFGTEFSGGTPPAGPTPWLTATFTQVAGGVQLQMSNVNLVGTEFVTGWYFNLNPALNPANLFLGFVSGEAATGISRGADGFKADGDGYFDFKLDFATASTADRFTAGETSTYLISGISGLTAADFNFLSAPGGGTGSWSSAAKVQGIGPAGGSGWVGGEVVPEPASWLLLGTVTATLAWGVLRRRRLQTQ